MAKSNAQKCKDYRKKKRTKLQMQEKSQKAKMREAMKKDPVKYKAFLSKDRERKKIAAMKKKAEKQGIQVTPDTTPTSSTFTTKQSRERCIRKAERALPKSPRKKSEVAQNLAKKFELKILMPARGRKKHKLTQEQQHTWQT